MDGSVHTLILERVRKGHGSLLVIGILERKAVDFAVIDIIAFRSLHFLNIVAVPNRKVGLIGCSPVTSGGYFFNEGIFLYNNCARIILDVICGIQTVNASIQWIFRLVVLFCHGYGSLLSGIGKCHASRCRFHGASSVA